MKRYLLLFYNRKLRKSRYLIRMALFGGFVLLMALMLSKSYQQRIQYKVGEPWQGQTLRAPFDFSIYKTPDSLLAEQIKVVSEVRPVFVYDTGKVSLTYANIRQILASYDPLLAQYKEAKDAREANSIQQAQQEFTRNFQISPDQLLQSNEQSSSERLLDLSISLTDSIYKQGYLKHPYPDTLPDILALRLSPTLENDIPTQNLLLQPSSLEPFIKKNGKFINASEALLITELLRREVQPNFVYSEALTIAERERRKKLILPVYDKIAQNEIIVEKGEKVDKRTHAVLRSFQREEELRYGSQNRGINFLSRVLIIWLISVLLWTYMSVHRPRIYFNNSKIALILSTFILVVGAMVLASRLTHFVLRVDDIVGPKWDLSYVYLAPACIVPIFISNFFDDRTGFMSNLILALYGSVLVQQGLEFAFVQIMAGTVVVYRLRKVKKRKEFFYTLGYVFLAYVTAYLVFTLFSRGSFQAINYSNIFLFAINVALTVIAYNLIYPFERIFGVTSELTYLELLDTNHPLLKELARKAPGTFQHSLQVANIAEAAVNVVGGNALLTHVGALYHDIGKMAHPQYFIENMPEENPHEHISNPASAEIIIGHVSKGIVMAHKHNLPKAIIDFIETHHGTTRVEYFYRMYLKENGSKEGEDDSLFRYPGPTPFSKETAVLMIADSIEAASRSLKKPTPEDVKNLVNSIIDYKINDKQLSNSNLTFKDIEAIRKVICKQLMSIYHSRIEYPKESPSGVSQISS